MEYSLLPEKSSSTDLKRAIEGLIRGRELTQRLKEIMKNPLEDGVTTTIAENLVVKIMDSFSDTISMINSSESDEVSQVTAMGSPSSEKSLEDSSGSCKSSSFKDRRGCYKRRKTSETNIKESSALVDDGHAWRKYGQKQILNSSYPRHYFRCTHKYDQKCQATKQVQKIQDNPPLFRTTYYGQHICKAFPSVSQIILDTQIDGDSSVILSFDQKNINHNYHPTFPSRKQETKEEVLQISSNSHYYLPANDHPTPATFEASSGHMAAALSPDVISSGGVYSSCTSSDNLDIDIDHFEEYLWNFE